MTNLSEEMNVSPRQRITVPEGYVALILSQAIIADVRSMCITLRKARRLSPEDKFSMRSIAGDILLAIVETEE